MWKFIPLGNPSVSYSNPYVCNLFLLPPICLYFEAYNLHCVCATTHILPHDSEQERVLPVNTGRYHNPNDHKEHWGKHIQKYQQFCMYHVALGIPPDH